MSKSIAYLKFKVLLEKEIRSFWHLLTALEYSERWLKEHNPVRLTQHPGDNRYPFKAIDFTPGQFLAEQADVAAHLRENTLVSFVTTFECYLAELLERVLYLDPPLISDSDMPIPARELCDVVQTVNMRRWLAAKVTDKYLRNKTHKEMIGRIDKICESGVSRALASEIEEWSQWSLVRNCIVHTSRQVTAELSKAWPSRFPVPGARTNISNEELARIHHLALKIASAIDTRAVNTRIKKHDELLIAREIFIQKGVSRPNQLVATLSGLMRVSITQLDVSRMLSAHKNGTYQDDWQLSHRELTSLIG